VCVAEPVLPLAPTEDERLFAGLAEASALILAVSGGPDSTALMMLAARWRTARASGPKLVAVTVDHGLRAQSAAEAKAVGALARKFGVTHRTVRWTGKKPRTGLQEAARHARYRLLAAEAAKAGARHVLTAHTLDDQAETVLLRLARGSGLSGLAAMTRENALFGITVVRPLLAVSKARLIATLRRARIAYADDPSNRDPRFTRARLRTILPALAREGLTAERLAVLARRVRRAETALERAVDAASAQLAVRREPAGAGIALDAAGFAALPEEIGLRLLGRAVAELGDEGPVELAKLENLHALVREHARTGSPVRRTLAGAAVACRGSLVLVERAPPRRAAGGGRISALTKGQTGSNGRTRSG